MSDLEELIGANASQEPVSEVEQPEANGDGEQPEPSVEAEQSESGEQPEQSNEEEKIPYGVFKSTRDDLKGQIAELQRQLQTKQAPEPEPPKMPDVFEDQEGFGQFINNQIQNATTTARLDMSEAMARDAYGDDVVDAAFQAAQASGVDPDRFIKQKHPYKELVSWHKQQQVIHEIGDDPEAYKEKLKGELMAELKQTMAAEQVKEMASKAAPSMANINGSGGQRDPGWSGPVDLTSVLGE